MQEQLISFETAKLAKEKGLIISTRCGYFGDFGDLDGDTYPFLGTYSFYRDLKCYNNEEHQIATPSQSLLQKWLREKYNLIIIVYLNKEKRESNFIYNYTFHVHYENDILGLASYTDGTLYKTYEEALEIGLEKGLELI